MLNPTRLGIYIHVPFCRYICGYCDFCAVGIGNSGSKSNEVLQNYHNLVISELNMHSELLRNNVITSLYFGGGTPSLLTIEQIQAIYSSLDEMSTFAIDFSFEMESNPDDMTPEYADGLAAVGVQRLSIGVQSFDCEVLKKLERQHSPKSVATAVGAVKTAGMECSLDLIYGTPGETLKSWEATLEQAVAFEPNHISAYALTLEPDVRMSKMIQRSKLEPVNEDFQAAEYELAEKILSQNNYSWYEISNWARTEVQVLNQGRNHKLFNTQTNQSAHNLNYWNNGNWLGIGPGSHSHLATAAGEPYLNDQIDLVPNSQLIQAPQGNRTTYQRFWNTTNLTEYAILVQSGQLPVVGQEVIPPKTHEFERIMLFCRQNRQFQSYGGTNSAIPTAATDETSPVFSDAEIRHLVAENYLDSKTCRLTLKGRLLNDEVVRILTSSLANGVDDDISAPDINIVSTSAIQKSVTKQESVTLSGAHQICTKYQTTQCLACPICIME